MTGEMQSIQQDGTDSDGEVWSAHAELAKRLGGKLLPFDKYQGPYIRIGSITLWLIYEPEDGLGVKVWNETTFTDSEWVMADDNIAIEAAARSVL